MQAQSAASSGQGSVIKKSQCVAQGGVISGKGQITRKDGTVIDFVLTGDPLTQEQADAINQANGSKE